MLNLYKYSSIKQHRPSLSSPTSFYHHINIMTTTTKLNHENLLSISRTNSINMIPSNYMLTTSFMIDPISTTEHKPLVAKTSPISLRRFSSTRSSFYKLIRSFITVISIPTCRLLALPSHHFSLTPSLGRVVTGTLFGNRRGQVSFAVQYDPRSAPVLIIEFAMSTATLVKEMSSGMVRIALECEKRVVAGSNGKLKNEPMWIMYCNGRRSGFASLKACSESAWHVLSMVKSVSIGAGVIPTVEDGRKGVGGSSEGELVYMRAKFERIVGNRDSEAYYMMNPDHVNGGPELSIFMLRI